MMEAASWGLRMAEERRDRLKSFDFRKQVELDYNIECEKHLIPQLDQLLIAFGGIGGGGTSNGPSLTAGGSFHSDPQQNLNPLLQNPRVREWTETLINFLVRANIDIAFQVIEEDLTYCKIMEQQLRETIEHLIALQTEYFKEISSLRNKYLQQLDEKANIFNPEKFNNEEQLYVQEMAEAWKALPDFEKHRALFLDPKEEWQQRLRPLSLRNDDESSPNGVGGGAGGAGSQKSLPVLSKPYEVDALPWFFDVNGGHLGKKIQELCALMVAHRVKEIRARDKEMEEAARKARMAKDDEAVPSSMMDENLMKETLEENKRLQKENRELKAQNADKDEEIANLQKLLEEQSKRIEELSLENEELKQSSRRNSTSKTRKSQEMELEMDELKRQVAQLEFKNSELDLENENLKQELEKALQQLKVAMDSDAEAATAGDPDARRRSLSKKEEIQQLKEQVDQYLKIIKMKDQEIATLSKDNTTKQRTIDELMAKLALMEQILERQKSQLSALSADQNLNLMDELGLKKMVDEHLDKNFHSMRNVFERLYQDAFDKRDRMTELQQRFRDLQLEGLLGILQSYPRSNLSRSPRASIVSGLRQVSLSPLKKGGFKFILAPLKDHESSGSVEEKQQSELQAAPPSTKPVSDVPMKFGLLQNGSSSSTAKFTTRPRTSPETSLVQINVKAKQNCEKKNLTTRLPGFQQSLYHSSQGTHSWRAGTGNSIEELAKKDLATQKFNEQQKEKNLNHAAINNSSKVVPTKKLLYNQMKPSASTIGLFDVNSSSHIAPAPSPSDPGFFSASAQRMSNQPHQHNESRYSDHSAMPAVSDVEEENQGIKINMITQIEELLPQSLEELLAPHLQKLPLLEGE
ncbi:unnamed protein product [Amoebophrya sp. A120]|nr:unnamed protein product [Amoebophrya sp. A120]|eukprot:GSA120T00009612001.1